MELRVESERDRVLLVFSYRGRDLQLSPDQADRVAEAIEQASDSCQQWMDAGGKGTPVEGTGRGAKVKSWDGKVNVRFDSIIKEESIPYKAARLLAGEIRAKAEEARGRMTINWQPARS